MIVQVAQLVPQGGQLLLGSIATPEQLGANGFLPLHELEEIAEGIARVLEGGLLAVGLDLLVEHPHAHAGRERADAALGCQGPGEDAEEGRLPGAVPPDEPNARVVSRAKGEILEEGPRAESVGQAVEADQDHPFGRSASLRFIFSAFSFFSRSTSSASWPRGTPSQ